MGLLASSERRCAMVMEILMWAGVGVVGFLIVCGLVAFWRGCCCRGRECKN